MLTKRHKILVVDDEHAIASTLATILGYQGYETATAGLWIHSKGSIQGAGTKKRRFVSKNR
jgi:DNA-binding NtrC family response regulator